MLDSGLSSFVENPQYFCGIIKDKDMCKLIIYLCNVVSFCVAASEEERVM